MVLFLPRPLERGAHDDTTSNTVYAGDGARSPDQQRAAWSSGGGGAHDAATLQGVASAPSGDRPVHRGATPQDDPTTPATPSSWWRRNGLPSSPSFSLRGVALALRSRFPAATPSTGAWAAFIDLGGSS
jgi:hypothetical protein